jgi:hypothetical protein
MIKRPTSLVFSHRPSADPAAIDDQLAELSGLRELAMDNVRRLKANLDGAPASAPPSDDMITEYVDMAAIVRQVIVLEMELKGTPLSGSFEPAGDLDDYDRGPIGQVVARIRNTLGVEPPSNDPFAPPPLQAHFAVPRRAKAGTKDILLRTTHLDARTVH